MPRLSIPSAGSLLALLCVAPLIAATADVAVAQDRPNILWVSSEDNGPELGAYGDDYADTPNIDALAERGLKYLHCWSSAPVCAPARTTIISGLYPPSTGAEHMRSETDLPEGFKMFPQHLREAGYYCTNNSKEDYNLSKPGQVWDESSNKAHWKNREDGQPFFAVFNFTVSHESRIRDKPHELVHDPAKAPVPAYHPDTPEVRRDWAQYYDRLTEMDALVGEKLTELKEAGLEEDTIVFYWGDHGSGMPRSKRFPYDSGLHVPLIVSIPQKYRHLAPPDYQAGWATDRLVAFVDFAPTVLSLAGVEIPEHFQGHAFAGTQTAQPQPYHYGFRGRMDERYDCMRTVSDGRYVYIRNFMPHKIYGQHVGYMFQTPTTQVWHKMYEAGELNEAQSHFWQRKPPEELYDLQSDPDEVHNLAESQEHQQTLLEMRQACRDWMADIRDIGLLPEGEIHSRAGNRTPYEMGHDPQAYPFERIYETADMASRLKSEAVPDLIAALDDDDSAVRFWGALGLLMREEAGVREARRPLRQALDDPNGYVRSTAAEALAKYGRQRDLERSLDVLLEAANYKNTDVWTAMWALNAIDELEEKAQPILDEAVNVPDPTDDKQVRGRMRGYISRLTGTLKEKQQD